MVEGKRVSVVDTPDWFNSEQTPDEVRAQISSCVALSSPGPHAFLLCVPLDQPAKTELQALEALGTVFGPEAVQKHTMVLFTYADKLRESGKVEGKSVENYIASQRGDLVKLVEKCRDRYHVMEKGDGWRQKQNVAELLEKVQQTVKEAGGQCYSTPAFQEAEEKVRQRQLEIAAGRRGIKPELAVDDGQLSSMRQSLAPINEEITEEEIVNTRDEAERIVSSANIESLPPVTLSTMSPSLLRSMMEKVESGAKMLPQLLANSSTWVEESAKQVKGSPVWGKIGSGAQNVQKMVADSPMWEKVGTTAGQVSQAVGKRVPQKVVDGSAWVGSGAKAVTSSPMWGKVGSGAKNLAKSPVWGKVGSGAKTGAKLMADGSVKVGAGIGAGAKKVAQSPVWEKMGAGVKAGAKRVSESSVWEKMGNTAKQVPKTVIIGAILGLVLGVILAGLIGGAVGTGAGAAVSEVVRRKFSNKSTSDGTINAEILANNSTDGRKLMKTE
uniref:AIG1-type G domain-containing protein n=2 Tax=Cyprinodon variegatus TaxID=28743 RepID=A0A3Q2GAR9_CYPVA